MRRARLALQRLTFLKKDVQVAYIMILSKMRLTKALINIPVCAG